MSYIGNTSTTQSFAPAIDYFNGNGSTTAFTLSRPVASVAQVQVVVNNVAQNPSSAYTVSGNTITFTSAPSSGTNNIYVYYTSPITQVMQPSVGTVGKAQLDIYGGTGTGAMTLPAGTTAQRPSNPVVGDTRWNTTLAQQEIYVGYNTWQSVATPNYTVDYFVAAGGGGGGPNYNNTPGGGGGGAGGYLTGAAFSVTAGTAYTITIGAGGIGGSGGAAATSGSNSTALGFSPVGGGRGGSYNPGASPASGGSGGGAAYAISGASGTAGQGFAGGNGQTSNQVGGGGGGATSAGETPGGTTGGAGGAAISNSYSGSAVSYCGGGGGGAGWNSGNIGGTAGSGGGNGGNYNSNGLSATANLGGGGGGGGGYGASGGLGTTNGGNGGSGVAIIRYAGSTQRATGGTVTISGGYVIHTFTTSGTFTA